MNLIGFLQGDLDQQLNDLIEIQDFTLQQTPLMSADKLKHLFKKEMEKILSGKVLTTQTIETIDFIYKHIKDVCSVEESNLVEKELDQSNEHFVTSLTKAIENQQEISEALSMKDLFGLSSQSTELIYRLGNDLLNKKIFSEAKNVFNFLVYLAPEVSQFWVSLAQCCYQQEQKTEALTFLEIAKVINPDNPSIYIHKIEILIADKQKPMAITEFKALEERMNKNSSLAQEWKFYVEKLRTDLF